MKIPSFKEENKLRRAGYKKVAGVDEVGRGPLAGPVIACAVAINGANPPKIKNVRDSKQLSARQREMIYQELIQHPGVEWGVGVVSEKIIDKINILEATKLAMQKAVQKLARPNFLILDGNFSIKSNIPQKSIIKGDEKVCSCSCASIIAKVTRDKLMQKYDQKYPYYHFASNKGYGTKIHREMLKKHGPSKIHRQTFTWV